MSIESTILSQVFNIDNWAKYPLIDLRGKFPDVTDEWDIVFSETNPTVCRADLHYIKDCKKNTGKYPVLLNIHGGGWIIGDKSNSTSYCLPIADSGFFVMNINYGMPAKDVPALFESVDPKKNHDSAYVWPYAIQTHFLAMKWLSENAEKYNLDLDNVFVSGDSAGSHMTAVVAACFCSDEYANALGIERPNFTPKGYVMNCGIYNVGFYKHIPIARAMMQKFVGMDDPTQSPLWKYLDPTPFINKKANNVLVVKGMIDIMTIFQSDTMVKHLKAAGVNTDFYVGHGVPNSFHDFMFLTFTKESKKCMRFTANWLNAVASNK